MYSKDFKQKRQDTSLDAYMESIKDSKHLGAKEQVDLVLRAQKGDLAARNRVIESNLRFVVFFIEKEYRDAGVELYELVSVGNLGLMKAIETFDPAKGQNFLTYARWKIRAAVTDYFRKNHYCDSLDEEHVTDDCPDEMSDCCGMPTGDRSGECFLYDEEVEETNRKLLVSYFMKDLDERQRYILSRFFGLDGGKEANLDDIARDLGISIEYVRKIKDSTLKRLTCKAVEKPELQRLYFHDDSF